MAGHPVLSGKEVLARSRSAFVERGYAARTRQIAPAVGLICGAIARRFGTSVRCFSGRWLRWSAARSRLPSGRSAWTCPACWNGENRLVGALAAAPAVPPRACRIRPRQRGGGPRAEADCRLRGARAPRIAEDGHEPEMLTRGRRDADGRRGATVRGAEAAVGRGPGVHRRRRQPSVRTLNRATSPRGCGHWRGGEDGRCARLQAIGAAAGLSRTASGRDLATGR
jgi:hypothetical protein